VRALPLLTGRALRSGLWGLLALLAGIAVFEFVQPVVIASFGGAPGLNAILRSVPPAMQAFVRTRPEFQALSGLSGYLSLGFTHPLYLVLAGAAVISFAARALAGEMDRGTIQVALSRPISRQSVYASRVIGAAVISILLAFIGPAGMVAGLLYARPAGQFSYENLLLEALNGLALFWAIAGLALLGSAAASTAGRVIGLAIALLALSYFVDYFAGVWSVLKPFTVFSLFYYEPTQALVSGQVSAPDLITLGAVGAVAAFAGAVVFALRDLPG
jgi:ABC-2 type transport system permease protein